MRGAVATSCVDQNKLPLGLYIDEIHRAWPNLLSRGTKLKRARGSLFASQTPISGPPDIRYHSSAPSKSAAKSS